MRGIFTALVTPFNNRLELDLPAFKRILKTQADAKVTGVVVCRSTGESTTLTHDEKQTLFQTAVRELKGSGVKVLAGTGTYNTRESIELSTMAEKEGVDGLLLVVPYYNKPSQFGMESHFTAIANSVKCEIMLYNVPGRTGVSLTPDTVVRLADHPRIRALKDATGTTSFAADTLEQLADKNIKMDILSGDDGNFLPLCSVGAVGVVSVASNVIPKEMVALHQAVEKSQLSEAVRLHQLYYPLFRDQFIESNPVPIKWVMQYRGLCGAEIRQPLGALTNASIEKLRTSLKRCKIPEGKPHD